MLTARRSITVRSARRISGALIALGAAIGLAVAAPGVASAGTVLPGLVSSVPSSTTPNIFPGDASTGVNSSGCSTTWFGTDSSIDCLSTVYSEAIVNGEVVVVGAFTQVCQPGTAANGYCTPGTLVTRDDIFAYSLATGAIDPNFAPQIDQGPIYAVAAGRRARTPSISAARSRPSTAPARAASHSSTSRRPTPPPTGHWSPRSRATSATWSTSWRSARTEPRCTPAASSPPPTAPPRPRIVRFNATTGAVDPSFKFTLSNPENGAALKVEAMALSPDGPPGHRRDLPRRRNSAYDGGVAQSRPRMAVVDTGTTLGATASLGDFTAPILANNCSAEHDYVRAVDFGAGGSYIAVGTTGYLSAGGPSICDAVARFNDRDGVREHRHRRRRVAGRINFSGGDSFYAVDTSGPIVYAAGHNRWVNNQCGVDSLCAPNAVLADGVAALDANTGLALPWWEPQTTRGHGTQFLSTFPAGPPGPTAASCSAQMSAASAGYSTARRRCSP